MLLHKAYLVANASNKKMLELRDERLMFWNRNKNLVITDLVNMREIEFNNSMNYFYHQNSMMQLKNGNILGHSFFNCVIYSLDGKEECLRFVLWIQ